MISQRNSPARAAPDEASAPRESGWAACLERFMSAILTYLRFNVTKLPFGEETLCCFVCDRVWGGLRKPGRGAEAGKLDSRAIVVRHIGKHTGLRHPAKACPEDMRLW